MMEALKLAGQLLTAIRELTEAVRRLTYVIDHPKDRA